MLFLYFLFVYSFFICNFELLKATKLFLTIKKMTTQNYDTQSQNGISVTSNQNEVEVTQGSESKAYRNGGSACDYETVTKAVKHPAGWVVDGKFCQYDNKGRVYLWFNTTPSYNSICGCTEYRISLGSCGLVSVKKYFNGEME